MPFRSKRQWRFAFASGQPWARRWARETPSFDALPATKADAEPATAPARKPMTPAERAQHAALVRWGKKNPLGARLQALREKRKAKAGSGAPKDTRTAQEKANQNRAAVAEQTGLGKDLDGAMARLAAGMGGAKDEANADKLVSQGLARKDPVTGRYSLSPEGKRYMAAAKRGDVDGARAAMGEAKDRKASAAAERDKAKAEKDKAAAEKPKKGGGGGGGGGKQEKPDKAEERAQRAAETARSVGLRDLDALRKAAESGGAESAALAKLGLIGPDGDATDQGRRALGALERGDVRGYRAALQDAQGRMTRESEAQRRKGEAEQARAKRERDAADKDKAKADAEREELQGLADDFKQRRKGLTMREQRRLEAAGLGRFDDKGQFSVKAWRWEGKSFTPPDAVQRAAAAALERRAKQPPSRRGGTAVGLARARDLANGTSLSLDTVQRMNSFFARHDKTRPATPDPNSPWAQAWGLWGGNAGWRWARGIVRREEQG